MDAMARLLDSYTSVLQNSRASFLQPEENDAHVGQIWNSVEDDQNTKTIAVLGL